MRAPVPTSPTPPLTLCPPPRDIGEKTDKEETLQEKELKDLLSFDPTKSALGKDKE